MAGQKNPGGNAGNDKDKDGGSSSSPGPIGGHDSYGMDKDTFDKTIGRDHQTGGGGEGKGGSGGDSASSSQRADFDSVRNAFRRAEVADLSPSESSGSLADESSEGSLTSQYGRFSTPGPIGGAASYGVSQDTFDTMEAPHRAASVARQEDWARDVLATGGPQTEAERQRLENLASGRTTAQAVGFASDVAGAVNPVAGLGVQLAGYIGKRFATPEFQAGYASVGEDDSGTAGSVATGLGIASKLTGSTGLARTAQAIDRISPFGDVVESGYTDRGQLYSDIGEAAGIERADPSDVGSKAVDTDFFGAITGEPKTMAGQFYGGSTIQFAPTNYSNYIDNYMKQVLGGGS